MLDDCYFGSYARFEAISKDITPELMGADNIVGDRYSIVFKEGEDQVTRAFLVNRFDSEIATLDPSLSRRLNILAARGWSLNAYLSFIAFTDSPDPGIYWGEVAIICFDTKYEQMFLNFSQKISSRLSEGIRPEVDLGEQAVSSIIENNGDWLPKKTLPLPTKKKGTAILKSRRSFSEGVIEKGREGNKGCYVVSIAFIVVVVLLVLLALKSCVGL